MASRYISSDKAKGSNKINKIIDDLKMYDDNIPENIIVLLREAYCSFCMVGIHSLLMCVAHYNGKRHQRRLEFYGEAAGHYTLDLEDAVLRRFDLMVVHNFNGLSSKDVLAYNVSVDNTDKNWDNCEICSTFFTNADMATQHYQGKKHKRRLLARKQIINTTSEYKCEVCNVMTTCEENHLSHVKGKAHLKAMEVLNDMIKERPHNMSKSGVIDYSCGESASRYNPTDIQPLIGAKEYPRKHKSSGIYNPYRNVFMLDQSLIE